MAKSPEERYFESFLKARGMTQEYEHPQAGRVKALGNPVKLSRTPAALRRPPPMLGEHTQAILREIGYEPSQIEVLKNKAVIA